MKLRILYLVVCAQGICAGDEQTGYLVMLANQTGERLTGTLYLMLIEDNKSNQKPIVIDPGKAFIFYARKVADNLTSAQMGQVDIAGKVVGFAVQATAAAFDVELPPQAADAIAQLPALIIKAADACLSGFTIDFKGYRYSYQFGNGCRNQNFTLKAVNLGTELRIFDDHGNVDSWGSVTRVGKVPPAQLPSAAPAA